MSRYYWLVRKCIERKILCMFFICSADASMSLQFRVLYNRDSLHLWEAVRRNASISYTYKKVLVPILLKIRAAGDSP